MTPRPRPLRDGSPVLATRSLYTATVKTRGTLFCPLTSRIVPNQASFSNLLNNVPTCGSISTEKTSPCLMATLGLRPAPTPAGVPVTMTVPARRVVPWDRKLTILGTSKMRSLFSPPARYLVSEDQCGAFDGGEDENTRNSSLETDLLYPAVLHDRVVEEAADTQLRRVRNQALADDCGTC